MRVLPFLVALTACADGLPRLPSATASAVCGDGVQSVGEACDDGNLSNSDGCVGEQCSMASCGDGFLRADLEPGEPGYEACDDGNSDDTDACRGNCRVARCGDAAGISLRELWVR